MITLALQLLAKLVLLILAVRHGVGWSALVLLPAWASRRRMVDDAALSAGSR